MAAASSARAAASPALLGGAKLGEAQGLETLAAVQRALAVEIDRTSRERAGGLGGPAGRGTGARRARPSLGRAGVPDGRAAAAPHGGGLRAALRPRARGGRRAPPPGARRARLQAGRGRRGRLCCARDWHRFRAAGVVAGGAA
ncbi:unnamed protein product [Prorocentrum cordatum]|uniref:Uncharacterized protein n=1 Tax=Prorocentrum cordatum TaxID=2364126 RepID=A0ABN9QLY4_9DINO|nr:unnamed protein product [Polarella glacialis]